MQDLSDLQESLQKPTNTDADLIDFYDNQNNLIENWNDIHNLSEEYFEEGGSALTVKLPKTWLNTIVYEYGGLMKPVVLDTAGMQRLSDLQEKVQPLCGTLTI